DSSVSRRPPRPPPSLPAPPPLLPPSTPPPPRDLLLPIEIVACPTVREPDGLAMSSRNVYLTAEERAQALSLSAGLRAASEAFDAGERDAGRLRAMARERIEAQPLAEISYVSLADSETLEELDGAVARAAMLSVAVRFSGATLIDNVTIEPSP
ncbi:MAG: 4-phosphopantoate--beta-alanine ligase, partial [Chloroflexi bacterium]|nr:4-phosphopantoate--beta-alanine ligase [Chloroflexota bacterium]